jgi:lysozyme
MQPLSPDQCEELMLRDLEPCVQSAVQISPVLLENENALGAISSFIYNLGSGAYYRSTLRRKINEGDWERAREEILKWVWGGGRRLPGLVLRRNEEATFLYK